MSASIAVLLWILGGIMLASVDEEVGDAPWWAAFLRCALWPLIVLIECWSWVRDGLR